MVTNDTVIYSDAKNKDGFRDPLSSLVFENDDRNTVIDTTSYPYSAIMRVETAKLACTGTMI